MESPRKRVRELGITPGILPLGKWNAITDVPGVKVGHVTLIGEGDVRTGVTAILPHVGNLFQEKVPAGAKDPPSVQRVRVAQRQWIVYRDNECRKKVPAKTKGLWAKARANCLAEFAGRRAGELADDFSKLTAH